MATLTVEQVGKKLNHLKKNFTAQREYLNDFLEQSDEGEIKELWNYLLSPDKKQSTMDIFKGNSLGEYKLAYETFANSLEPIYYWIFDALKGDTFGFRYDVTKVKDAFAAAEASALYGELGRRRTELEKRASELVGTINMVVKSILNLIYDLKEFELRLDEYDKLHSDEHAVSNGADYALKTIWLTEVDSKKGPGSINALVQNLNYIMVRDAFFSVYIPAVKAGEKVDDVEKKVLKKIQDEMDIPDMVKRILQGRIKEYILWRKMSELELRKRYKIERTYLKSQVSSMKMYTEWARPYLIATRKLLPPELRADEMADLPTAFNSMVTYIDIFGKKEVKSAGNSGELKIKDEKNKVFSIIEVKFYYRVIPGGQTQEGYRGHLGRVNIFINGYEMRQKDLDNLEKARQDEVMSFIDIGTKDTLDVISDDLKRFLEQEEKEKTEEKKIEKKFQPFKEHIESVKKHYDSIKEGVEKIASVVETVNKIGQDQQENWNIKRLRKAAQEKGKKDAYKLYYLYKAIHGMLIWE